MNMDTFVHYLLVIILIIWSSLQKYVLSCIFQTIKSQYTKRNTEYYGITTAKIMHNSLSTVWQNIQQ